MPVALIDELRTMADSGVAVVIGTRNDRNEPEISRAWGLRVRAERGALQLHIPVASNVRALANIGANSHLAVTLVSPSTYRSLQVKGHVLATGPATADDLALVRRHCAAFLREVEPLGLPAALASRLLDAETELDPTMVRIEVTIDAVFDQTPGPVAGARL